MITESKLFEPGRHTALFLFLCFLAVITVGPARAASIRVPADQPTIQAGIDASINGDTVLVADGLYTGPGNRDIDFLGKAIIVRSEYGPDNCIIDCQGSEADQCRGFIFQNGEGRDSVLQGFTIRGGDMGVYEFGGGVECTNSSPSILDNLIVENRAYFGAGINVGSGSPLIAGNRIKNNVAMDHAYSMGLGGGICCGGSPEVVGNIISGNVSGMMGGGIGVIGVDVQLVNNLVIGNLVQVSGSSTIAPNGGGIGCDSTTVTITNCTIAFNSIDDPEANGYGGGLCHGPPAWEPGYLPTTVSVVNSIIFGNEADFGDQCHVGHTRNGPCTLSLGHSDVEGGEAAVSNMNGELVWGEGMIDADPFFVDGSIGYWYLGQTAAGQPANSPCLDSGSQGADLICYDAGSGTICLDQLTTRSDRSLDSGTVDLGYHYLPAASVAARLDCNPTTGILPFITTMEVELANRFLTQRRRIAGRIDVQLGGGQFVSSWRAGFTNLNGGQGYDTSWAQNIPALPALEGVNQFTINTMDVTPAPWNQPPYPPSGDTFTDTCLLIGIAP